MKVRTANLLMHAVCITTIVVLGGVLVALVAKDRNSIVADGGAAGIPSVERGTAESAARVSSRRSGSQVRAEAVVSSITVNDIAALKQLEQLYKEENPANEKEIRRLQQYLQDRVGAFSSKDLQAFVKSVSVCGDLTDGQRSQLMWRAINAGFMVRRDYECGLNLILDHSTVLKDELGQLLGLEGHFRGWCETDVDSALAWFRKSRRRYDGVEVEHMKESVCEAMADRDSVAAYKLIGELELQDAKGVVQSVVLSGAKKKPGAEVVAELHEFLETLPDQDMRAEVRGTALGCLGMNKARVGFQEAKDWAGSAGLSGRELIEYCGNLWVGIKEGDEGKWLDYYHSDLRKFGIRATSVRTIMNNWAQRDFEAAGRWLRGAPEGFVRNHAAFSYATEIVGLDPGVAEQWAGTITNEKLRNEALGLIYCGLPKNTPEQKQAAREFRAKHGLPEP